MFAESQPGGTDSAEYSIKNAHEQLSYKTLYKCMNHTLITGIFQRQMNRELKTGQNVYIKTGK